MNLLKRFVRNLKDTIETNKNTAEYLDFLLENGADAETVLCDVKLNEERRIVMIESFFAIDAFITCMAALYAILFTALSSGILPMAILIISVIFANVYFLSVVFVNIWAHIIVKNAYKKHILTF